MWTEIAMEKDAGQESIYRFRLDRAAPLCSPQTRATLYYPYKNARTSIPCLVPPPQVSFTGLPNAQTLTACIIIMVLKLIPRSSTTVLLGSLHIFANPEWRQGCQEYGVGGPPEYCLAVLQNRKTRFP